MTMPNFAELAGEIADLVASQGLPMDQAADNRPRIVVNRQMHEVSQDAVGALVARNAVSPVVFKTGGNLARISREADGAGNDLVMIKVYNHGGLRGHLGRSAVWVRAGADADADVPPPREVVDDLLGNADIFGLPILQHVVHCPTFAQDGSLHDRPGYSAMTQSWYEPRGSLDLGELPLAPTDDDIHSAVQLLLYDYLVDFPFEGEADRTHALALLLLPFVRAMIQGPTPMHLVEASTPGTGKGLLTKAVFLLSHGADVPSMTEARDEGEWSKALTAKFATGQPVVFIDNVSQALNSAKLAAALTQPIWEDRLLGGSRMLICPITHVFVATGNNVSMSGELARRTIRIRLNAHVEQPWMRDGFTHDDLVGWGRENRSALVRAALVLVRAWLARGRPMWGGKPLGSFEDWSRVVGGILDVAGVKDFLGNLQQFYSASTDTGDDEYPLVTAWFEKFGEQEMLARDLVEVAAYVDSGGAGVSESFLDRMTPKALSKRLRTLNGRVYGDLEVVHVRRKGKPDRYKLVKMKSKNSDAVNDAVTDNEQEQ